MNPPADPTAHPAAAPAGSAPAGQAGQAGRAGAASWAAKLEDRLRRDLMDAGFTVEPLEACGPPGAYGTRANAADGGLCLRRVPGRGVVVSWDTRPDLAAHDLAKYETIRTAVQLALLTILRHAGYQVRAGSDGGDVLAVSAGPDGLACPPDDPL